MKGKAMFVEITDGILNMDGVVSIRLIKDCDIDNYGLESCNVGDYLMVYRDYDVRVISKDDFNKIKDVVISK